jgi:hypothetical protein
VGRGRARKPPVVDADLRVEEEPKIVVLAFKIDENARSSGSRENPRMSVVRVFGTGGGLK